MATIEFVVDGMHCANCGLLIDETVEDLAGVERCETDVRRGRSRVTCDADLVGVAEIAAAIADAGYPAQPVAGN